MNNNDIAFWLISQRILPPITVIIPVYILYQQLGLLDTQFSLIASYAAVNLPIVIWFMSDYLRTIPIEVEGITPDRVRGLSLAEIEKLEVFQGNYKTSLAEFFAVSGDPSDGRLDWEGDLLTVHWIGAKMQDGVMHLEGRGGLVTAPHDGRWRLAGAQRSRRAALPDRGARERSRPRLDRGDRVVGGPRRREAREEDVQRGPVCAGDGLLVMVASDRLSAFDVVLSDPIPDKGRVLNEMANFWFERLGHIVPNQLTGIDPESVVAQDERPQVRGRSVVVKKLKPLPIEAVVRGYLIGSGWKDYQQTGRVCGIELPKGLQQAQKLPEPIFTPATKAETGHDENISFDEVVKLIGRPMAEKVREVSIRLYKEASEYAATKGIIIADTKFEFGLDSKNELVLIDEVLTADSSRFWPADSYRVGISPPSYDKQFVRDYLETLDWNKEPPAPRLPAEVIARTSEKYREALQRLTGRTLS